MKPVAVILEAGRGRSLIEDRVCTTAPVYRMVGNPDGLQPYPFGEPWTSVRAYARAIAQDWGAQADDTPKILNLFGLLRSCSDLRWEEEHRATYATILRGLVDGSWACEWDIEMLGKLAREMDRIGIPRDFLVYDDFEVGPAAGDPLYAQMLQDWMRGSGGTPDDFDARVREVAFNTSKIILSAVGWSKIPIIQVNHALHRWNPHHITEPGWYCGAEAEWETDTFAAWLEVAREKACAGVLIFTSAQTTDAHLESHRSAIQAFCSAL